MLLAAERDVSQARLHAQRQRPFALSRAGVSARSRSRARPRSPPSSCSRWSCSTAAASPKATASPTILSKRSRACSRSSSASSRPARCCGAMPSSPPTASPSPRSTPPSSPSHLTPQLRPVATRQFQFSTNCGDTPASAHAGFGTRWSRRRRARSAAVSRCSYAGFSRRESCCSKNCTSAAWQLPEVGPSLHAGDGMLCSRGTASRSPAGRTRRGCARCAASCAPAPTRA